ncbi:hypothetical protein BKA65DRAFT_507870 [Rhexocercosporidium sp. MPI-PUGE-AT-0058]|nr:hypothetical protein BKA65DRAFT_507870 [Rhexocercosporidium sp. MPI-PUGE-AT-0058]
MQPQPHSLAFLVGLTPRRKKKGEPSPPKPLPPRSRRLTVGEIPSPSLEVVVPHPPEDRTQNASRGNLSRLANRFNFFNFNSTKPEPSSDPLPLPPPTIAHPQEVSPIFLLPTELRLQIYTLVLGNRNIHLGLETEDDNRHSPYLRHYHCKYGRQDLFIDPWHDCWSPRGGRPKDPVQKILSLLLTCRRVYSEAIDLLYSANTFQLENLHLVKHLHTLVLPQRLQAMQRLVLILRFDRFPLAPNEMEDNELSQAMVWKTLSEMKGLREVHLHLQAAETDDRMWRDDGSCRDALRTQIRPLVERLDAFRVWLPVMKILTWEGMERDSFAVWPSQ